MPKIWVEITVIIALLVVNGLLSLAETSLVSARKTCLRELEKDGHKGATAALVLLKNPTHFLSTIQIGISLIGILMGAYGGATLSTDLTQYLQNTFQLSLRFASTLSLALIVFGITYFSVVVGELIPKVLAIHLSENIAIRIANPLRMVTKIFFPLVWILSRPTVWILQMFGLRGEGKGSNLTHNEIHAVIAQGARDGVFAEDERDIVEGALSISRRRVRDIMTVSHDIVWIDLNRSLEEQLSVFREGQHSQYPVARGSLDQLLGIVHTKDLCCSDDPSKTLPLLLRDAIFIPEGSPATKVLDIFKSSGSHMAFVADEFGTLRGLVTLDDILRALVGDIPQRVQKSKAQIVELNDGSYLLEGQLPLHNLLTILGVHPSKIEFNRNYHTLAGFVMHKTSSIPSKGDSFLWKDWLFTVEKMDHHKVALVHCRKIKPSTAK
jgi:putative hemolysin